MSWFIGFASLETPLEQCERSNPNLISISLLVHIVMTSRETRMQSMYIRNKSHSSDTVVAVEASFPREKHLRMLKQS